VFLQDFRFYQRALSPAEIAQVAGYGLVRDFLAHKPDDRTSSQTNLIYDLYLAGFDRPSQELQQEMAGLKTREGEYRARGATTLVMEEKPDSEPTAYLLTRGNYAAKTEKVSAITPQALPPMEADLPRNRLGLARWLMAPENPLTARVTVNRI